MEWALWIFRNPQDECSICRSAQKDGWVAEKCQGIEYVDKCPRGNVPKLLDENREFWALFEKILPGLCNGKGGFDYRAIDIVFDSYRTPRAIRHIHFDKCLIVIEAIQKIREEERNKPRFAR